MNECKHGFRLDRTTRDGWPLCPDCRRIAKRATPTATDDLPKITPPKFDHQALVAQTFDWDE